MQDRAATGPGNAMPGPASTETAPEGARREEAGRRTPPQPPTGGHAALAALAAAPGDWALFLDIDGTLLDLAPAPDAVEVPPALPGTLAGLARRLDGALALVTGRGCDWAEAAFAPFRFPVAGLHGVERRHADGRIHRLPPPPDLPLVRAELAALRLPGVLFEDKGMAFALHYRQVPALEPEVEDVMTALLARLGPGWALQRGKMVRELRPEGADKGQAVAGFLAEAPFHGRRPLVLGDDVTDEAMFALATTRGGMAVRIGDPGAATLAQGHLPSPAALRAALEGMA